MEQLDIFSFLPKDQAEQYTKKVATDWKWSFSDYPTRDKNALTAFSCFACGGGSTMGYKLAGVNVLGCCEIDKRMNDIYIHNHKPKYNYLMDIRDFNNLDNLPDDLYNLDILDGSPPCTTFSMSGIREENWGKAKKFREGQAEQTLDDLSFIFIETVKKLRPKVVIMENVEGLLLGEAWGYVQKIYSDFKEAGYKTAHFLVKGENCGIPQTRHRVFFVSIRNDIGIDPIYIDMSFNYEPILYKEIKSGTGKPINPNSVIYKYAKNIEPGDRALCDVVERQGEPRKFFSEIIVWDNDVCPTITAKGQIYRAYELAHISVEDIIHAQTFPEDFDFINRSVNNVCYICGMSVPPVMIKRVVEKLINQGVFDYKLKEVTL